MLVPTKLPMINSILDLVYPMLMTMSLILVGWWKINVRQTVASVCHLPLRQTKRKKESTTTTTATTTTTSRRLVEYFVIVSAKPTRIVLDDDDDETSLTTNTNTTTTTVIPKQTTKKLKPTKMAHVRRCISDNPTPLQLQRMASRAVHLQETNPTTTSDNGFSIGRMSPTLLCKYSARNLINAYDMT